jgi:hypothetical protein
MGSASRVGGGFGSLFASRKRFEKAEGGFAGASPYQAKAGFEVWSKNLSRVRNANM